jgi:hypothetical protein
MDTKKFALATIAGGVTLFILGYLFYVVLLGGFFEANAGTATGAMKDQPIFWAVLLGELGAAALITLVVGWSGASGAAGGFKTAATVGFLVAFSINFIIFGVMNVSSLTAALVDLPVAAIRWGVAGAVIGMLGSKGGGGSGSM